MPFPPLDLRCTRTFGSANAITRAPTVARGIEAAWRTAIGPDPAIAIFRPGELGWLLGVDIALLSNSGKWPRRLKPS
jgi:hypothetical protein